MLQNLGLCMASTVQFVVSIEVLPFSVFITIKRYGETIKTKIVDQPHMWRIYIKSEICIFLNLCKYVIVSLETIYKFSRIDVLLLQQIIVLFLCGFFYFHDANVEVNHCSNILFLNKRSIGHITHMSKGIVLGSLETRLGKPIYHYKLFSR